MVEALHIVTFPRPYARSCAHVVHSKANFKLVGCTTDFTYLFSYPPTAWPLLRRVHNDTFWPNAGEAQTFLPPPPSTLVQLTRTQEATVKHCTYDAV